MERKDESSKTKSCDPFKLDRTFCRELASHVLKSLDAGDPCRPCYIIMCVDSGVKKLQFK